MSEENSVSEQNNEPELIRGVGLWGATTLNMIDMIGVGPFITMPLIIAAMGGPQAMIGWIVGAILVTCDGLVWAELGASMPKSGGPYNYLKEIYGAGKLGRLMSFLFIWQLTFSAPLSIASGSIGFAGYATYAFPSLNIEFFTKELKLQLPLLGDFYFEYRGDGRNDCGDGRGRFLRFSAVSQNHGDREICQRFVGCRDAHDYLDYLRRVDEF